MISCLQFTKTRVRDTARLQRAANLPWKGQSVAPAVIGEALMNSIVEVRSFLAALAGGGAPAARLPPELHRLARGVTHGDTEQAQDLVGDLIVDLLERRGQAGSVVRLLALDDRGLLAALRCRLLQVRAAHLGSKSRLVKALRAHVTAAIETELPAVDALPLTLVVGDRLNCRLVRDAIAFLLARTDAPRREPRVLAAELLALYFTARPDDVRAAAHGEGDAGHEQDVLRRADANRHVDQLRDRLGRELARVVGLRAQGRTLAKIGTASTVHEQLGRAVAKALEHVREHELAREDLEPVLETLAA